MSGQQPEEPRKDWMEIWHETGEITWQEPLSPESEGRLIDYFDELIEEQNASEGDE